MLLALLACAPDQESQPSASPGDPTKIGRPILVIHPGTVDDEPHAVMEALYIGPLAVQGRCLRLGPDGPVPVWHPGTRIEPSGDGWAIYERDRLVAATGETVRMGGGGAGPDAAFSDACPGPYWIVGGTAF